MALNYSHWPLFPAHISEDNLLSPMRLANGYFMNDVRRSMNEDGLFRPWPRIPGEGMERNFLCWEGANTCSSQESTSDDIVDLLPSDPFGMDMQNTLTVFTGWIKDLELEYGGKIWANDCRAAQGGDTFFSKWNMTCDDSLIFSLFPNTNSVCKKPNVDCFTSCSQVREKPSTSKSSFPSSEKLDEKLEAARTVEEKDIQAGFVPFDIGFQHPHDVTFGNGGASSSSGLASGERVESVDECEGMPHEALGYAVAYLGVKDLLSVEMVCKSLLTTVRDDPLLWRTIHIDKPLSELITDDTLVKLTSRAQGHLTCLSLEECKKITDDGLKRALEMNPRLTKLCVPGCTRITIKGVMSIVRSYNSGKRDGGLKLLRIGGIFGVNREIFEELKFLLGFDENKLGSGYKPHFYSRDTYYLPHHDDRPIDIESCPKCEAFRMVYDCPVDSCNVKDESSEVCRGCNICIARCIECGKCLDKIPYLEDFCLELVCFSCFLSRGYNQDNVDMGIPPFLELMMT
ncbi:F-box protein SKIP14 isoform X2 [Andrographis paniculata]|uniref:F-box protein SKIP14 isoform X2 n=1 Tax=Andrographis paniculata TaxID=175694 RepID=UPI0021E71E6E|nr:F-box protein SKIP14 isoform X2 [Andrographis paniculata]